MTLLSAYNDKICSATLQKMNQIDQYDKIAVDFFQPFVQVLRVHFSFLNVIKFERRRGHNNNPFNCKGNTKEKVEKLR